MIAYKLFRLRKDGSLGPLFINARQRLYVASPSSAPYVAEAHPTKGFTFRPGWHCCSEPVAPHLSKRGRVWCRVKISDYTEHQRPASQGGLWYTANRLSILEVLR